MAEQGHRLAALQLDLLERVKPAYARKRARAMRWQYGYQLRYGSLDGAFLAPYLAD